ncbi:MAG TPA: alpha/beta hydrolase [Candidatus Limnocylindria bacterium]|nr:alpha/beta hydrolase [Candidatus Limnocylindria bacterium]
MPWRETPAELERAKAEQPILVPSPHGQLYGIYTPPAPEAPPAGLCAVLLTSPRSHRNRMWVEGARRLAGLGFSAFRVDFHGTGDSEGETGFRDPNRPYQDDAVAVIRHLREAFGEKRFVLSGSCFDARTALSALAEEREAIAGILFMAAPVMSLDLQVKADADRKGWGHLLKALRNPENWTALSRPERWRYMGNMLGRMAQRTVTGAQTMDLPLASGFVEHFQILVRSRARALFLYGRQDVEYQTFRPAEQVLFPRLDDEARERIQLEVWPGTVHGLLEMNRQREIFERAMAWFASFRSTGAPAPSAAPARPARDLARGGPEAAWTSR